MLITLAGAEYTRALKLYLYIPNSGKGEIKAAQVQKNQTVKTSEASTLWKTISFDNSLDQCAHLFKINFRLYSLLQVPGSNMDNFSNDAY